MPPSQPACAQSKPPQAVPAAAVPRALQPVPHPDWILPSHPACHAPQPQKNAVSPLPVPAAFPQEQERIQRTQAQFPACCVPPYPQVFPSHFPAWTAYLSAANHPNRRLPSRWVNLVRNCWTNCAAARQPLYCRFGYSACCCADCYTPRRMYRVRNDRTLSRCFPLVPWKMPAQNGSDGAADDTGTYPAVVRYAVPCCACHHPAAKTD